MSEFKTIHELPFESAEWVTDQFKRFRVGTCKGLWCSTDFSYDILAITNDNPGNGHFEDVLQWFFNSCLRDKKKLRILELWNNDFKKHLIEKRKFELSGKDNVEISYKKIKKMICGKQQYTLI